MIPQVRQATVLPRHERDSTTYDVVPDGAKTPVLRLYKPYFYDSLQPLRALVGPGLDQPAGWVSAKGATAADKVRIGTVAQHSSLVTRKHTWNFEQAGLPPLRGEPRGVAAKLLHSSPLGAVPLSGTLDMALEYRVGFQTPGCEGFEFARLKGAQPRYALTIRDQRVNLLLALAAIVRYDWLLSPNPKASAMNLTFPKRA